MKIVVIGGDGQLGSDLVTAFTTNGDAVRALTHSHIEIANPASVSCLLEEIQPEVIINTAAMHHVENCEREPEKAFAVNGLGPKNLAVVAQSLKAVLMHISTDYVFDGSKGSPYTEDDNPHPLNTYGITKLAGEHFVRSNSERHFVIRTSGLYGRSPCRAKGGLNFVELMLKLGRERQEVRVVDSEVVSPTSTVELARQLVQLSRSDSYGVYHATAEGSCSWYEFAQEIFALTDAPVRLKVAESGEFPSKVPRPKYSVLENQALKIRGLNICKHWREGLHSYLEGRTQVRIGSDKYVTAPTTANRT
jgi:dTDP-4-dehydrorhamnose reductase